MMYGTRQRFAYFECTVCRCVQITEAPADLGAHYPTNYYSFSQPKLRSAVKRAIRRHRLKNLLEKRGAFWTWINQRFPQQPAWLSWVRKSCIGVNTRILDVGCGAGQLLVNMSNWGFRRLTGVEPYIERDITYSKDLKVLKRSIEQLEGEFDFIMFHHSFEHIGKPLSALRSACRLLAPDGRVLIRIPVADCEAWRIYGADWVQLDAPRHLFLHTRKSIQVLAGQTGFTVEEVVFDSYDFQFWGSELYRRGVPLHNRTTGKGVDPRLVFSAKELQDFSTRARELNEQGRGDQACFFLRRTRRMRHREVPDAHGR
jgi:SAM-dependent methyltransferase